MPIVFSNQRTLSNAGFSSSPIAFGHFGTAPTAGNILVLTFISELGRLNLTVTDDQLNEYTFLHEVTDTFGQVNQIYRSTAALSGTMPTTINYSWTGGGTRYVVCNYREASGVDLDNLGTTATSATPNGNAVETVDLVTGTANEAAVAVIHGTSDNSFAITSPSGGTSLAGQYGGDVQWEDVGAAGTITFTLTNNAPANTTMGIATLRVAGAGGNTYNESRSEALSLAETQSSLATFASSHSEPLPLADSSAGLAVFTLSHSEVLSLDATQASLMVSPVSVSEALALAETESSLAVLGNSHSEALTLAESAASLGVFPASQADALALAETEASTAVFAGSVSEALALAESQDGNVLGGPSTYNESVSEPLSLAESPASLGIFPAELTENAALAEAVAASGAFPVSQTDALSLAESWAGITAMAVSVSEALALVDGSSSQGALVASLAEALSLAEVQSIPALALSLSQADIDAIAAALIAHPKTLTVPRFLALK